MRKPLIKVKYSFLSAAIALAIAVPAQAYKSPKHVFTTNDIQGGFDGSTYAPTATTTAPKFLFKNDIFCDLDPAVPCPADTPPITDKDGTVLYPIDSQFGFYVADFLGAQTKEYDGDYGEGYAGDILRDGVPVGIRISNSSTESYKVPAGMGSWCSGLGGTKVKCDSERYSVMEHILSCFETIPYSYADPITGIQGTRELPDGRTFDCANAQLDDVLTIIEGGMDTGVRITDVEGVDEDGDPADMEANDLTTILDDYATGDDYSMTLKDDGKPLYMWGNQIKRPNDVRMYARVAIPYAWTKRDPLTNQLPNIPITSAKLVVKHVVTNNPNDQLRPEDLENEAAIGRLPSYTVTGSGTTEVWSSLKDCYEGDGDIIDATIDPTQIASGTVLRNMPFAVPAVATDPEAPLAFSSDLKNAMTNGWYTTVDREPFEWSYRVLNTDVNTFEFKSSPTPLPGFTLADGTTYGMFEDESYGELTSGPRWRLKPNKFGQDLPGLEIPLTECTPPPYANDNIKYEVGAPVITVINLLDWDEEANGPSPLSTSNGWVTPNAFVEVAGTTPGGVRYTTNGLPMTNAFDLAVYVKGDKKPTSVYSAQLFVNEEPTAADLEPYVDPLAVGSGHSE